MEGESMAQNNPEEGAFIQSGSLRKRSTFESVKETVAQKLKETASKIDDKVEHSAEGKEALRGYGHQASEWLNHSADYIREIDLEKIKNDLRNEVKKNPGRSLLIAGAAGLVLGVVFRRR